MKCPVGLCLCVSGLVSPNGNSMSSGFSTTKDSEFKLITTEQIFGSSHEYEQFQVPTMSMGEMVHIQDKSVQEFKNVILNNCMIEDWEVKEMDKNTSKCFGKITFSFLTEEGKYGSVVGQLWKSPSLHSEI